MKRSVVFDGYTGEMVDYKKKTCKCGHVITFLSQHPAECRHCGRLVYPTDLCKFREKMKIEMRKVKYE